MHKNSASKNNAADLKNASMSFSMRENANREIVKYYIDFAWLTIINRLIVELTKFMQFSLKSCER